MGCHFLLQGIFPTQGLNLCLLNQQVNSLNTVPPGKPISLCVCAFGCGCVCTRTCSVAQLCPPLCNHMDCSQGTPKTINANAAAFLQHLSMQFSTTPRHVFHLLSRIPVPHVTQYWHGAPPVPGPFLWSPSSSSHPSSTNTEQADPNLDTYLIE